MNTLEQLPTELIFNICEIVDHAPTIHSLSQTCKRLHGIARVSLYRREVDQDVAIKWAVSHDEPDVIQLVLDHQVEPHRILQRGVLTSNFDEALKCGSFRAANRLFDAGAEIHYCADTFDHALGSAASIWISSASSRILGSLALAAKVRYHTLVDHNPLNSWHSEVTFWKWKKRVMQKIIHKLRQNFLARHAQNPTASSDEYQLELDSALVEASQVDAHSTEAMDLLITAGASVNIDADSQIVANVWQYALDEEVPSLFRAKVEFLLHRGIDVDSVRSLRNPWVRTPVDFFLRKLVEACELADDDEDSQEFIDRWLGLIKVLESLGCFRWPAISLEHLLQGQVVPILGADGLREPGLGQLESIWDTSNKTSRSWDKLRQALRQHLCGQLDQCPHKDRLTKDDASKPLTWEYRRSKLPIGIQRLEKHYLSWVRERRHL
ncbi:hypothetical protein CTRI78_v006436 [Colletotrichum trifolii]|uniref:F-box domain-containing protein n=1 Tax=Colletotrichum trifolii TaxID=5466 RepID=A0A4V3HW18_COLTR|nr:hypothetical protein CTRI78_v006436 [Colletotrichum trifolii]